MKKIAISLIGLLWMSIMAVGPASAAGFGIGVTGQFLNIEADGKEIENSDTDDTSTLTKSVDNDAIIGSFYAEITAGEDNGWALGYESIPGAADVSENVHTRTDTETSVTDDATANTDTRKFSANAEIENFRVAYIEAPFKAIYLRAGISKIDVNTNEVASSNGGNYPNTTLDGMQYGIGVKGIAKERLRWKLSYEMNDFDSLSLTSTGNSVASETNKLTADLDTWALKFGLGLQF